MFVTFYWTSKRGTGSYKAEVQDKGSKSRIRTKVDLCETLGNKSIPQLLFELTTLARKRRNST